MSRFYCDIHKSKNRAFCNSAGKNSLAFVLIPVFSLLQSNEILNTALLTGISQKIPVRVLALEAGGLVVDVTKQAGCETPSAQIVQVCIMILYQTDV